MVKFTTFMLMPVLAQTATLDCKFGGVFPSHAETIWDEWYAHFCAECFDQFIVC